MTTITDSSLCCAWCGVSLGTATRVTYLNGNMSVCDLCLIKAYSKKGDSTDTFLPNDFSSIKLEYFVDEYYRSKNE